MLDVRRSNWLMRSALIAVLFAIPSASTARAQTPAPSQQTLESILTRGTKVWLTLTEGPEQEGRVVRLSDEVLTIETGGDFRQLRTVDITRVRVRHSDSVINGALIGAGAAIASGLFLCTRTEPWENCRDDAGPIARIGAIGAAIGAALDAVIRPRKTVYETAPPPAELSALPLIVRGGGGLQVSVRF